MRGRAALDADPAVAGDRMVDDPEDRLAFLHQRDQRAVDRQAPRDPGTQWLGQTEQPAELVHDGGLAPGNDQAVDAVDLLRASQPQGGGAAGLQGLDVLAHVAGVPGTAPADDVLTSRSTDVELHSPALIPETYVADVHTRLMLYKRISSARDDEQLRELQIEMIDRFGLLPDPVRTLFHAHALRRLAEPMGIRKIDWGPNGGRIVFSDKPNIDTLSLIQLMQSKSANFRMEGSNQLRITLEIEELPARVESATVLLQSLRAKP